MGRCRLVLRMISIHYLNDKKQWQKMDMTWGTFVGGIVSGLYGIGKQIREMSKYEHNLTELIDRFINLSISSHLTLS